MGGCGANTKRVPARSCAIDPDILGDMNKIAKKYFTLKSQQPMYNKDVHSTKHKETAEQIMIFQK